MQESYFNIILNENYFNNTQGISDGYKAQKAAIIYFAVDMDIEDGNIPGTVIPYITGVAVSCTQYKIGIYGTRNVCIKATETGVVSTCFVSDMSTGYSGNLGFKMPKNWAFDQFVEYNLTADMGIEQVAASGRDEGTSEFEACDITPASIMGDIVNSVPALAIFAQTNFTLEMRKDIYTPIADYHLKWSDKITVGDDKKLGKVDITNGRITTSLNAPLQHFPNVFKQKDSDDAETLFNELAPAIDNGFIKVGPVAKDGRIGIKMIISAKQESCDNSTIKISVEIEIYWNVGGLPMEAPQEVEVYNDIENIQRHIVSNPDPDLVYVIVLGLAIVGVLAIGFSTAPGTGGTSASAALLLVSGMASTLK